MIKNFRILNKKVVCFKFLKFFFGNKKVIPPINFAFSFWPGTFFYHNDIPIKVGAAFSNQNVSLQPGEVAATAEGELLIGTAKYALQVQTLQKPGGKMLPSSEFLRGYDLRKGMKLDISKSQPLTVAKK